MTTAQPIPSHSFRQGTGGSRLQRSTSEFELENQCHNSKSPYVQGHENNAVSWQLWGEDAFELARKYNKLVFLSVGYASCHWCHVMERESFENEEIAGILNNSFVPILVDREERSDVDKIYLNYVQASAGTGGWPLTVFLTPDLAPVYGCTYLSGPDSRTPGMDTTQNFLTTLIKIRDVWVEQEERCLQSAHDVIEQLHQFTADGKQVPAGEESEELELDLIEEAWTGIVARYDAINGGFGSFPKFLHPANLNYFIRICSAPREVVDIVGTAELKSSLVIAMDTLSKMAQSGTYDQLGSGFHRYSITDDWSLPHFEKMLSDQAQMLAIYLDAYLLTKDVNHLSTAVELADYLAAGPLAAPDGAFYSSEDSDSSDSSAQKESREGAYYVWTRKEFDTVLGATHGEIVAKYYGLVADGNIASVHDVHHEFINQNVLQIRTTAEKLAKDFGLKEADMTEILEDSREKLLVWREKERPRPAVDVKIITAYNGLAIAALAQMAVVMEKLEPARATAYRTSAQRAAKFLYDNVWDKETGTISRLWNEGKGVDGFADDYAYLIWGLSYLYEATWDDSYLEWADQLQSKYLPCYPANEQKLNLNSFGTKPITASSPPSSNQTSSSDLKTAWMLQSLPSTVFLRLIF
jgi:uncharacterized protein YyaL (SSP411 family)